MRNEQGLANSILSWQVDTQAVNTGRKSLRCVGVHSDGLLIFEREPNKYDSFNSLYWIDFHKDRFKYWSLNNPHTSDYSHSVIHPSKYPDLEVHKNDSGAYGGIFFSPESICSLQKYGRWPLDKEYVPKSEVKVIKIPVLDKLLAHYSTNGHVFYYERRLEEVAFYTGKLTENSKDFAIPEIKKRYSLTELALRRGDLVMLQESERVTLGCIPLEKRFDYIFDGNDSCEVFEKDGKQYEILSRHLDRTKNGCHSPVGGAEYGDDCGCKRCNEFINRQRSQKN